MIWVANRPLVHSLVLYALLLQDFPQPAWQFSGGQQLRPSSGGTPQQAAAGSTAGHCGTTAAAVSGGLTAAAVHAGTAASNGSGAATACWGHEGHCCQPSDLAATAAAAAAGSECGGRHTQPNQQKQDRNSHPCCGQADGDTDTSGAAAAAGLHGLPCAAAEAERSFSECAADQQRTCLLSKSCCSCMPVQQLITMSEPQHILPGCQVAVKCTACTAPLNVAHTVHSVDVLFDVHCMPYAYRKHKLCMASSVQAVRAHYKPSQYIT